MKLHPKCFRQDRFWDKRSFNPCLVNRIHGDYLELSKFHRLSCHSLPETALMVDCTPVTCSLRHHRDSWEISQLNSWTLVFHRGQYRITQTQLPASKMKCWRIVIKVMSAFSLLLAAQKVIHLTLMFPTSQPAQCLINSQCKLPCAVFSLEKYLNYVTHRLQPKQYRRERSFACF